MSVKPPQPGSQSPITALKLICWGSLFDPGSGFELGDLGRAEIQQLSPSCPPLKLSTKKILCLLRKHSA